MFGSEMALRYQDSEDEIDRLAKEERATPVLVLLVVMFALIAGIWEFLIGKNLKSYEQELGWLLGFAFAYWMLSPFYYEFRIRTKETEGKATAILERLEKLEEGFGMRLNAIEEKLDKVEDRVDELR